MLTLNKKNLPDYIIYSVVIILISLDYLSLVFSHKFTIVYITFLPILVISLYGFLKNKGFLTIDQMVYVFSFVFCYYTPIHQYANNINIHNFSVYSDFDYVWANILIAIFFIIYLLTRKIGKKKIYNKSNFSIYLSNTNMFMLMIISSFSLVWLYLNHSLFSFADTSSLLNGDSLSVVILKIIRFIPVSSLLLYIYSKKDRTIKGNKSINSFFTIIIVLTCVVIFFPLNGTISRYLLFGTYIMVLRSIFSDSSHKGYILLAALFGFYFIFPAFNFFKYNTIDNLSQFQLGGFDSGAIDYDAYQMFLQSFHYVQKYGLLWGKNLLTALFCIIPKSIWTGKLNATGEIVANSYNAAFTNLSFPLFAEFYISFNVIGLVIFSYLFGKLINLFESLYKTNNIIFKAIYSINVGMTIVYLRGSLLPMTSFWISLNVALLICSLICIIFGGKNENSMQRK